jgi:alpha-glucosidase (family GH31 glycosyl hydrolase)
MSTGNSAGEIFFIFADTAPQLVSAYHQNIVGLPVLTPFWALGWH